MDTQFNGIWVPQHVISRWTEPGTTRRCINIIMLILSEINIQSCTVRLLETGRELELSVQYSTAMTNAFIMVRKWLDRSKTDRIEPDHRKVMGMEAALKTKRQNASDAISYIASFFLPFTVQPHLYE